MAQIFDDDGTDGILLVDCNIQITFPEMSISSTRTEVPRDCSPVEGKRSSPRKGQHRGLRAHIPEVKQGRYYRNSTVWLADDSTEGRPTDLLCNWYKLFCQEGKKCGYLIADSKARVVKTQDLTNEADLVFGEGVRITTEGQDRRPETRVQGWLNSVALEEQGLWCKKKGFVSQRHDGNPEPSHISSQQSLQECRGRAPPPTDGH
ncbi:unnamed protein product [Porites lobata]|uniref:Uncharacterized protein n=1 Tax=Porites lobata TaxID=104759 RepID=A0ABN8QVY3_9CNID|nr:unnamed protein product [Porites lobata]